MNALAKMLKGPFYLVLLLLLFFFWVLWMLFMWLVCNAKFAQLICTLNINILIPHAFNLEVQHLIPIFNKISLLCR